MIKTKRIYLIDDVVTSADFIDYEELGLNTLSLIIEEGTNRIIYYYEANEFLTFEFDTFAEVGALFQESFRQIIRDNNLEIEIFEDATNYYERLKNL